MRSLSFGWAGAAALVFAVGCGSSVDQLFPGEAGGAGGSGADGGAGNGSGASSGAGAGSASGAGATTGAGAASTGSGAASVGSGGSGASGPGATSSVSSGTSGPSSAVATTGTGGSGTCNHDVCEVGEPLDPFCSDCTLKVCQQDPSCCQNFWHDGCAALAGEQCGCFVDPGCASCSDFLNGGMSEPLCPWSEQLVNELFNCACGFACSQDCSDACMGGGTSASCQNCVVSSCSFELQNCLNDF